MALGLVFILPGCKNKQSEECVFVTSFYPIYIIMMNLTEGAEGVELVNMAQNQTGCLHDFQLQSDDMKKIEQSTAFIINGAGMESFMNKVIEEAPNINVIDSSEGIELIEDDDHHDHDHDDTDHEDHEDHEHGEKNAHIWVSITNYIKQVENITKGIEAADPSHAELYRANSKKYIEKLNSLKTEMHEELDNVKNKDIITFHEAFPYFAKEFGLNILAVINREPNSEPSVKELADTVELIRSTGTNCLFVEPQYPDTAAQTISKETGAKIYTLDPAVSGKAEKDSYINVMKENMKVLKEALS